MRLALICGALIVIGTALADPSTCTGGGVCVTDDRLELVEAKSRIHSMLDAGYSIKLPMSGITRTYSAVDSWD